jgi:hypothetical protein
MLSVSKWVLNRVGTDRIRILDAGFYGQKLKKMYSKMTKLLEQPVSLHREHTALKKHVAMRIFFLYFWCLFWPLLIQIW